MSITSSTQTHNVSGFSSTVTARKTLRLFLLTVFIVLLIPLTSAKLMAQHGWMPERSDRLVNDYSSILSQEQRANLEHRLEAFSDSTSNQILIVITPTLGGDEENAVAQRIGQTWGVGQKDFNNGVVILIKSKTNEENWGAVAISTGYGVEGVLPDTFCKRIIDDNMLSPLGDGEYYEALVEALDIIEPVLAGEYNFKEYKRDEWITRLVTAIIVILVVILPICLTFSGFLGHSGSGRGGGHHGGGHHGGSSGGSYHVGGHSSGSSGSGFGGFGGGSFGGGGASGRF